MLTVLLSTRNRAAVLSETLRTFTELYPPQGGWRLIVVDNASSDQTSRVLSAFTGRLPLRSMQEPRPGKNFALNAGLAAAEGDLIVFTDDDIRPDPHWLVELREAANGHPEYSMFGGVILPHWEEPPPPWIHLVELGPVFTISDPSLRDGPILPAHLYGPNMALRAGIFDSGVRFDPSIGPRGADYPMGSETELVLRLAGKGHKAWHASRAIVRHWIRREQLHKDWVLQRAIRFGRGQYRLQQDRWPSCICRDLLKAGLSVTIAAARFRQDALFRARWRLNFHLGRAKEALRSN